MELSSSRLPASRSLSLAYAISFVVAGLVAIASTAGLGFGSSHLYGDDATVVRWFRGWDAANLVVGLPILLGALWLVRRGSPIGLLLWPGALYYVLYTYALYVIGAPFNTVFLVYVALVTLSAFTTIGLVASIDGDDVRQRLTGAPNRIIGGALVAVGLLATAALTVPVITTLAGTDAVDPLLHAEWIVDYLIGNPVLLIGGVLLWRCSPLGYASAPGLLFLSGVNGVAFAVSGVLGAVLAGTLVDVAVIAVHLAIAVVCFAFLVVLLRGVVPAHGEDRARGPRPHVRPRRNVAADAAHSQRR